MAWTETFHCNVCNKEKSEQAGDWWLATFDTTTGAPGASPQPTMTVVRWDNVLAHSSEVRHLCGARCVHTLMDRWMLAKPAAVHPER
jgi:hypothetical protein